MKKTFFYGTIMFILILSGCASIDNIVPKNDFYIDGNNGLTTDIAKSWFQKTILNSSQSRQNGSLKSILAHWKFSVQKKNGKGGSFVSIPVFEIESDKITEEHLNNKSFDLYLLRESPFAVNELVIYPDEKGKLQYELIKYIPDSKIRIQDPIKFTGHTIVTDWNGKFIKGYKIKDGNIVGNIYPKEVTKNGKVLVCEYVDTSWTEAGANENGGYIIYHQSGYFSGCGGQDPNANAGLYGLIPSNPITGSGNTGGTTTTVLTPQEIIDKLAQLLNEILPGGGCLVEKQHYYANPIEGIQQGDILETTKVYSNLFFCSDFDNGNQNAFKHMFWNALMAKKWGYAIARNLSDLHEQCPGSNPSSTIMDKFNNDVGATYGHLHNNYSTYYIAMEIYCKIKSGEGRYFPPTGGIIAPTNDKGNCNNYLNTIACLI